MKQARNNWFITDKYRGTAVANYFYDLDKVFSCTGKKITSDRISQVIKIKVGVKYYYVKRYYAAGKAFRRYFGRSRIRAEWESLIAFANLGVAIPQIVGFGQRTELGQFKYGAMITEEIADSIDLATLMETHPEILQDKQWRLSVMNQIADYTGKIHNAGYVHGNLNWRNILVTLNGEPRIYFIDCPAGGLRRGKALHKQKLNDFSVIVAGECYEKTEKYDAARYYYQATVTRWPQTPAAAEARVRLMAFGETDEPVVDTIAPGGTESSQETQ